MAQSASRPASRAPGGRTLRPESLTSEERARLAQASRRAEETEQSISLLFEGEQGSEGVTVALPEDLARVLAGALAEVAAGRRVHVAAEDEELTTQEAADLLGVSRPYLVGLLEEGKIPFRKVGTHRRVRFEDVLAYRQTMRAAQEEAFDALVRQAQELGMGYEEGDEQAGEEDTRS